jgi:lysophospholipase L1-like esterase
MLLKIAGFIALQISCSSALQIASLGSSYAAGPDLSENYAQILAGKLGANLTDLSVSGSLLLNIGSQIDGIPADASIVTVTSGGNDLNYVGGLTAGVASKQTVTQEQLIGRFNDALSKIHTTAPNATVYLVEYLTVLGPDVMPGTTVPFNATEVDAFRSIFSTLQKATEAAVVGKDWVVDVPVSSQSVNNALGSAEPWVNGASGVSGDGAAWHPNSAGMSAVADMVCGRIQRTYAKRRLL